MDYKGAQIEKQYYGDGYQWVHSDYFDRSWNGDGWDTVGGGTASTVEECKEEIDDFLKTIK